MKYASPAVQEKLTPKRSAVRGSKLEVSVSKVKYSRLFNRLKNKEKSFSVRTNLYL